MHVQYPYIHTHTYVYMCIRTTHTLTHTYKTTTTVTATSPMRKKTEGVWGEETYEQVQAAVQSGNHVLWGSPG